MPFSGGLDSAGRSGGRGFLDRHVSYCQIVVTHDLLAYVVIGYDRDFIFVLHSVLSGQSA